MALRLYVQYCHIEDLDSFEPDVAAALRESKNGYLFKDGVKYRLNKQGFVDKIDAFLCAHPEPENPNISEPQKEKHKAKLIPPRKNQQLLSQLPIAEKEGRSTDALLRKMSVGSRAQEILYNKTPIEDSSIRLYTRKHASTLGEKVET